MFAYLQLLCDAQEQLHTYFVGRYGCCIKLKDLTESAASMLLLTILHSLLSMQSSSGVSQ